ncbi:uncharacterized protein isoform X1 [Leptinotarsa decemlineata]|uniref:uncharacterized protein isoform X1 n=1 Tax=Leptinotarsa decemlineata TaxID=7539 RepID=UPI003D30B8AB
MSQLLKLTEDTLRTLRCALCYCYLSVSPIIIISENGQEQKCGRCKDITPNNKINQKNVAFENLMKLVLFPCTFPDCEEKLTWENVEAHEKECRHRTIKCPIHSNCNDLIKIENIEFHFENSHGGYLFRDTISDLTMKFGDYSVALLIKDKIPFLLQRKVDESYCHFHIFSLKPKTDYYFEIKMSSPKTNGFSLLYVDDVTFYEERKHCMKCTSGRCNEKYHVYCNAYRKYVKKEIMTNKIEPQLAKSFLRSDVFTLTVNLFKYDSKPGDEQDELTAEEISICNSNNEKLMRQLLQCPVCMELMTAPILTCKTGHHICSSCRKRISVCPSCGSSFRDSRNYGLEELAQMGELFCENQPKGCNFIGNVDSIIKHLDACDLSD